MNRRQFISLSGLISLIMSKPSVAALSLEQVQQGMSQINKKGELVDIGYDFLSYENKIVQSYLGHIQRDQTVPYRKNNILVSQNAKAQRALESIYLPLTRSSTRKDLKWRVFLLETPIINAITPGGGLACVFSELIKICNTEAELVSVLAHEIGHIEHKHAIRRLMADQTLKQFDLSNNSEVNDVAIQNNGLLLNEMMKYSLEIFHTNFSRMWEHQADAFSIRVMKDHHYDLRQASLFFKKLAKLYGDTPKNLCIYTSHPQNQERIRRIDSIANTYGQAKKRRDSEAFQYLKKVVGHREIRV